MSNKPSSDAFTLVEVIIALGIVSFSLVALIGLLAGGYSGLRQSMDRSIQTQIVQAIASEIQVVDYSQITNGVSTNYLSKFPRYFDVDGQLTNAVKAQYFVNLQYQTSSVPGGTTNTSQALRMGIVVQRTNAGPSYSNMTAIWVVNNGR